MTSPTFSPIQQQERSDILDILRGFALLGIFIANCGVFTMYTFLSEEQRAALFTIKTDPFFNYFFHAFIVGKFYSIFSLLFGIGFSVILFRSELTGRNPLKILYRRLFILALLGLAHALLLWDGEILLLYALIGSFLPLFRKCSDKTLLILCIVLIFSPLLFDVAKVISRGGWDLSNPIEQRAIAVDAKNGIDEQNFRTWLVVHTDYESLFKFNQGGFFWRWEFLIGGNRIPKILGMFLLGLYVGRKMIYANLEQHKRLLKQVQRWGFIIGIPASLVYAWLTLKGTHLPKSGGLLETFSYAVSVVPLSLGYVTTLCLLWLDPTWKKRLMIFAPAGRMALTNYLMQTVIAITLYYGIGFGLGAKFGPTIFIPIAVVVFTVQVMLSKLWLTYFRFGPMEWIWRQLTYGKLMPIRKSKKIIVKVPQHNLL